MINALSGGDGETFYYKMTRKPFHEVVATLKKSIEGTGRLLQEKMEFKEALQEISKGEGAYDRNRLQHANNAIKNMKSIAIKALSKKESDE